MVQLITKQDMRIQYRLSQNKKYPGNNTIHVAPNVEWEMEEPVEVQLSNHLFFEGHTCSISVITSKETVYQVREYPIIVNKKSINQ